MFIIIICKIKNKKVIIINFTQEMKQIIINTYPQYGINKTIENLGLKESDKYDVQHMAQKLKLKRTNKFFTQKDIEFLTENYGIMSVDEICKILKRSKDIIHSKTSELNLKNNMFHYSEDDIQFLKDNYGKTSVEEIANKIHKTCSGIITKAYKLKLATKNEWTNEEIKILIEKYPHYTNLKLSEDFLPNRSSNAIFRMAQKYNLYKSNEKGCKWYDKNDILIQLYNKSIEIGKTPFASELNELGLPSETTYRRYFGSYVKACLEANLEPNHFIFGKSSTMIASDGTVCLSKSEYIVTEYLISKNIYFIKEPYYRDYITDERCGLKRFDWKVGDYFIEYFGMPEKPYYQERMQKKIQICEENDIKLIQLYRKDLKKLDNKLHILL